MAPGMLINGAFLLLLQIPAAAEYDRSYWDARVNDNNQGSRVYSLPPAVHYSPAPNFRQTSIIL